MGTFFDSFDTPAIAVTMAAILGPFGAAVETAGFLVPFPPEFVAHYRARGYASLWTARR